MYFAWTVSFLLPCWVWTLWGFDFSLTSIHLLPLYLLTLLNKSCSIAGFKGIRAFIILSFVATVGGNLECGSSFLPFPTIIKWLLFFCDSNILPQIAGKILTDLQCTAQNGENKHISLIFLASLADCLFFNFLVRNRDGTTVKIINFILTVGQNVTDIYC